MRVSKLDPDIQLALVMTHTSTKRFRLRVVMRRGDTEIELQSKIFKDEAEMWATVTETAADQLAEIADEALLAGHGKTL